MTPEEIQLLMSYLEDRDGGGDWAAISEASPEELQQLMAAGTVGDRAAQAQGLYSDALAMMQPRNRPHASVAGGVAEGLGNAVRGLVGGHTAGQQLKALQGLPGESAAARTLYAQLMARGQKPRDRKPLNFGDFVDPSSLFGLG